MPLYDYRCKGECQDIVEVFQNMKDDALKACPKCGCEGEEKFYRIVTGGCGVIFQGDGWIDKKNRMDVEDDKLVGLSRKVKAAKAEGRIPMEATVVTKEATREIRGGKGDYKEQPALHPKTVYGSE